MTDRVPREWESLTYIDAQKILVGLHRISVTQPLNTLRYHAASLRSRELRSFGEGRQAALFCHGMGSALGVKLFFAQQEKRDHDIVVRYEKNGSLNYVPVQLKEWVPEFLDPRSSLQSEIDKLGKYVSGKDLVVAFHINRESTVHLSKLDFSKCKLAGLWLFGATELSQQRWIIVGNLLSQNPMSCEFSYPTAA